MLVWFRACRVSADLCVIVGLTMCSQLHGLHGNKWTFVASQLTGRTDNQVKNRWHSHLKKLSQTEQVRWDQ